MSMSLRVLALILIIVGFILTYKPDLTNSSVPQLLEGYEMIEKRVKWGALIGLGIFLFFHHQWINWVLTVWAVLSALTLGVIIARLLGFLLDGLFAKQMLWLLIELVILGIFVFFYWKKKTGI